jgi:hypothetical protein
VPESAFELIELRRYLVEPKRRDDFVALFDREFTEAQEACGMVPIGHFRDRDDPRGFVWFRGFAHAEQRARALTAFYRESQAWQDHRAAANAALLDNDDVLLLRDARPGSGFELPAFARPAGTQAATRNTVAVAVLMLERAADDAFITAFEAELLPRLAALARGASYFVTDARPNDFPALPVREGEFAFVVTGICADDAALQAWPDVFARETLPAAMQALLLRSEVLRLEPAPRSIYGNDVLAPSTPEPRAFAT